MSKFTYDVAKDDVNAVQEADCRVQAMKDVLAALMESHVDDAGFLETPLVKRYMEMLGAAKCDFESKKDALAVKYIPEDIRNSAGNWNLDYGTGVLTVF